MRPFTLALITLSFASGCRVGPRIENLNLASSPRGTVVEVTRTSGSVRGELLAVNDDAIVVLEGRRMVTIPFALIREAKFPELGRSYYLVGGETPNAKEIGALRRVSHFPQGITPEIQAKLLTVYEQ